VRGLGRQGVHSNGMGADAFGQVLDQPDRLGAMNGASGIGQGAKLHAEQAEGDQREQGQRDQRFEQHDALLRLRAAGAVQHLSVP